MKRLVAVLAAGSFAATGAAGGGPDWRSLAPLPEARTEVAAAAARGEIAIVGGFVADGSSSARVEFYAPSSDSWRRGPDLPVAVNHAAATFATRLVVVGGYATGGATRRAFLLDGRRWRALPSLPAPRAAAGAAAIGGKIYVVGGVGRAGLAREAFALDARRQRWRTQPGPTPREHLAVASAGGRIYAIGGRTAGFDTNLTLVESWRPGERRWRREPAVPEPRGGTGAATVGDLIVSVGGEAPSGTLRRVYGFDVAKRRWRRLPDLPTPRHGLGVAAVGRTVYVIGGGPEPGLHVSDANEALTAG